ncbi:class I SAM-dependent methyltransferase [Rhodovulum kholense]|uniref:S-adenosylmethionine-diacylgycerolhomoserine-N-methyltransferase n=1 Tax=Rhodovulum kholense TaxID=453584 RepID=A0A8E2VMK8_9RHOB|nr:class I SAM-dependent methyltransferase [Rhodovulum kholense]PTW50473.1 S-adenosylmethionine-diacylgycerolhomoserine-N-methyltransferase [Rhodovulum kholense]
MTDTTEHAALMDATYRHQRLIYDATRAWFLLGRDRLIADLDPPAQGRVLEIACGTGRNLARIGARYPGRRLFGLDISREMLRTASARLNGRALLAEGDARRFDPNALFGTGAFDRIAISYALSMMPDWPEAIREAVRHLAPGGTLHIVDFHDQAELPEAFGRGLRAWLARFHVEPRTDLAGVVGRVAAETGGAASHRVLFRGYAQIAVIRQTSRGLR